MYSTYMSFHWESCVSCCKTWASIDFDSLDVSNLLFSFSTCVVQTPQHAPRMPSHPLNLLLSPASHNWSQEAGWAYSRIRIFSFEPGIIVALGIWELKLSVFTMHFDVLFLGMPGLKENVNETLCWMGWCCQSSMRRGCVACKLKEEQYELYVYAMHETNGCFYIGFMNVMIGPSKHHQPSICKTDM